MISVSNPQLSVIETLHKYSHDADAETAYNAIMALGIVGAGAFILVALLIGTHHSFRQQQRTFGESIATVGCLSRERCTVIDAGTHCTGAFP